PTRMRLKPDLASSLAVEAPIPEVAPVIIAVLFIS
ncbi:MAG: hypothetical protein ACI9FU_002436, partial [Granulosicoccus sp.]